MTSSPTATVAPGKLPACFVPHQPPRRQAASPRTRLHAAPRHAPSARLAQPSVPRRAVLTLLAALALPVPLPRQRSQPAAAAKPPTLEALTAPVLMCQRVLRPVSRYIDVGAWDKGRTNVNYCTRVLAVRRNMRDIAQSLRGDAFYDAMDLVEDLNNFMTQLDASLYTPLFIPADDGISVEQKKYQEQARAFYQQAVDALQRFVELVPDDVKERAVPIANRTKYEINLELE